MIRRAAIYIMPAILLAFQAAAQELRLGEAAYNRGDYVTAFRELRPLAEKGSAHAQYLLGSMYEYGWGVQRDYSRAVKWHRKAARQGNTDAKVNLHFLYLTGRASPQSGSLASDRRSTLLKEPLIRTKGNSGAALKDWPKLPRGGFGVQLGALKTKTRALKEAERLSRAHRSLLGDNKIKLVRADLGPRGVYYRLRVGPLDARASADALCRNLSASRESCIVVRP